MKLPFQIPVNNDRGAPMGRRTDNINNFEDMKVNLRRVPLIDGAYDQGGAYWGSPNNLWCAWCESDDQILVTYIRADTRDTAKSQLPDTCKFYR